MSCFVLKHNNINIYYILTERIYINNLCIYDKIYDQDILELEELKEKE